jgi:hypothetical protein
MKNKMNLPPLVKSVLEVVLCFALAAGMVSAQCGLEQLVRAAISK